MKPTRPTLTLLTGLALSGGAQATLFDRGGGLIYDDVLDVTWLQDANYAKTSGYDADGLMTWDQATVWAADLSYGGYDDWRLPSIFNEASSTGGCYFAISGGNCGFNVLTYDAGTGTVYSELAYMYYVNLGLKAPYNPDGSLRTDWGIFGNGTFNGIDDSSIGQNDLGPIQNLQNFVYWSGSEYAWDPAHSAMYFAMFAGYQDTYTKELTYYAWAVRPGDVAAPVPEPETYALLLAGLGLVGVAARRRRG